MITRLFLLCFFCVSVLATAQHSRLQAYTQEDGLPQSQVYDLVQDDIGYLWLGTQGGGLASFDGAKFDIYNTRNGLPSNYIHALSFTTDSLFIGTRKGVSIKTKGSFFSAEGPQVNQILHHDSSTFFATNNGVFVWRDNSLKKVRMHQEINTSIVKEVRFDGSAFWIATRKGLWKASDLTETPQKLEKIETNNFVSIAFYGDKVFAATFNDGTLVFDKDKPSKYELIREPLRINHIALYNEKELWIATDNNGITVIDAVNYAVIKKIGRRDGLTVSHIRKTMKDRQGNIWIASSGGGLFKHFQNNFKHYDKDTGLKGNRVYAVHHASDGIWLSNSEAGLVRIDATGIHPIQQDERLSEVKIKTITSDSNGNIWAGTDGRGILFREQRTLDSIVIDSTDVNAIKRDTISQTIVKNHVIDDEKGLVSDWVRTLYIKKDIIWMASYSKGISAFRYDASAETLKVVKNFGKKNGIEDLLIRDMKPDYKGRIWYATQNGHLGYIENNQLTHLPDVLGQNVAIGTLLFHEDFLVIGTSGSGIWWSDLSEPVTFTKLNGDKNTYSDNIYQLIFDDQGNLWVGTERGVDQIILSEEMEVVDVFHYGRNDGFLGIETCLNAVDKDAKGNLWFGAIYGLTQYQPGDTKKSSVKPKIHFEDVEVAYRSVDSIDLNLWTNSNKILSLTPEQTQVAFSYRTVDINHPNDVWYRFKLSDDAWSPWSKENRQSLAGLAYGSHTFTVQSRNLRWEESDTISFQFFIDSPLYKKPWFQWTAIGIAGLLLALITFVQVRRIQRSNKEERERLQMQNHLLSLEQKALRLQMNPHFIFNVLNGIKAMSSSNPGKMNTTINTFATLLRDTLNNSRQDEITLAQEIKTLKHYIEVEQLMTTKVFDYAIDVKTDLDPEEILIPPMLIQPFVENAIRHGILSVQHDGLLTITFNTTEEFLYCSITDNGVGIYQSQQAKKKSNHQSVALDVTKERIESMAGKGSLTIKEITAGNTIAGTQIQFKIPLVTDY